MGAENSQQQKQQIDAQTFEVNFLKIQYHLELKLERNQTELTKKEQQFLQMINQQIGEPFNEFNMAQLLCGQFNNQKAIQTIIRYCKLLKDYSTQLAECKGNYKNIENISHYIQSIIWLSNYVDLDQLEQFKNLAIQYFGQEYVQVALNGFNIDFELKSCFLSTDRETIIVYLQNYSQKYSVDMKKLYQIGMYSMQIKNQNIVNQNEIINQQQQQNYSVNQIYNQQQNIPQQPQYYQQQIQQCQLNYNNNQGLNPQFLQNQYQFQQQNFVQNNDLINNQNQIFQQNQNLIQFQNQDSQDINQIQQNQLVLNQNQKLQQNDNFQDQKEINQFNNQEKEQKDILFLQNDQPKLNDFSLYKIKEEKLKNIESLEYRLKCLQKAGV